MSSIAYLSSPNQNTKPGSIIYSETIISQNMTVSQTVTSNTITSQTVNSNTIDCNSLTSNIVQCDILESKGDLQITSPGNINMTGGLYSNGFSVPCWRASQFKDMQPILNTTDEMSIIPDALNGSMTIKPRVNDAFTLKLLNSYRISQGPSTEFIIFFKLNDVTEMKVVIPPTGVADQQCNLELTVNYREDSNRLVISASVIRNKDYSILVSESINGIWDPNVDNTISMTGQFTDTDGQWYNNLFDMWSSQST